MTFLRIATASLNQTPLDWRGNLRRIHQAIEQAREAHAQVLLLPELSLTGYGCEDAFLSTDVLERARRSLDGLLPLAPEVVVVVGLPILHRNAIYNAAAVLAGGRLQGLVPKQHLAGDGLHYEPRWFRAWQPGVRERWRDGVPIGDLLFELDGVRVGFEICEDAWVADRPGRRLARRGVDLILNPSASHFALGKHTIRRHLVLDSSRALGCVYAYANLLGNEAGRVIYDGGNLIAVPGELVAEGKRFGFEEVVLATATVDIDVVRRRQASSASYEPGLGLDDEAIALQLGRRYPKLDNEPLSTPATWETGNDLEFQELTRAIALGLFDYLRKSGTRGFVVSLSGGADSTACALLVATMVELAVGELGLEAFVERAGLRALGDVRSVPDLIRSLLVCIYQGTRHSRDESREAAGVVSSALGAELYIWDVDPIVQSYVTLSEGALGRGLSWAEDDVALQNVQARVRAPGAWMIANIRNHLLLSTSNRSEAAVGYATMDGDTCGSLAPIAGIDKAFLLRWMHWMTRVGVVRPRPEIELVTSRAPSAELRPEALGQRDEDDLMPYPILDAIEGLAIRDREGPLMTYQKARALFPERDAEVMHRWVETFFRLWARNQWKRERYAPSFHLDDESLDPKTWCRFPILSGAFAEELDELREIVGRQSASARESGSTRKEMV